MGGRRRVGTHQLGQRGEAAGVAPGDDDVPDLRAARLQLGGQVAIVEAAPVPGADVAACIARVGKVRDLGDAVRRQRIQRDDAHAEHAEDGADELRQVGQVDNDSITAAESAGQKTGRDGGCLAVQVGIADALAFTHHGDAVGMGQSPFAQPRAEGLAPPVAGLAVAAGQVLGPRVMQSNGISHANDYQSGKRLNLIIRNTPRALIRGVQCLCRSGLLQVHQIGAIQRHGQKASVHLVQCLHGHAFVEPVGMDPAGQRLDEHHVQR